MIEGQVSSDATLVLPTRLLRFAWSSILQIGRCLSSTGIVPFAAPGSVVGAASPATVRITPVSRKSASGSLKFPAKRLPLLFNSFCRTAKCSAVRTHYFDYLLSYLG